MTLAHSLDLFLAHIHQSEVRFGSLRSLHRLSSVGTVSAKLSIQPRSKTKCIFHEPLVDHEDLHCREIVNPTSGSAISTPTRCAIAWPHPRNNFAVCISIKWLGKRIPGGCVATRVQLFFDSQITYCQWEGLDEDQIMPWVRLPAPNRRTNRLIQGRTIRRAGEKAVPSIQTPNCQAASDKHIERSNLFAGNARSIP